MKKISILLWTLFYLTYLSGQVNGVITIENNQKFLRIWGTHTERGYAQGSLLAEEIMDLTENYIVGYTFYNHAATYNYSSNLISDNFIFEENYLDELAGIISGMEDSEADLFIESLGRAVNIDDLKLANALIDLSTFLATNENFQSNFGCSSLVSWGSSTLDDPILQGEIVISRLLDWATHPSLIANSIMVIHEPSETDEQKWLSFTYPGLIGSLTAINETKIYSELNMGNHHTYQSGPVQPILLDIRTGIEKIDYNQDTICNAEDVWDAVNDQSHSSGYIILVANPTVEENPAFYIEVNNLGITRRIIEDNSVLHGNNIASTNHFRKLYDPIYCSRYSGLINSTEIDSTLTIEENFDTLIDNCALSSNMMTIQYIPSIDEIRWSNYGDLPAYLENIYSYNLDLLFDGNNNDYEEYAVHYSNNISNYPNPFNSSATGRYPTTTIEFSIKHDSKINLSVYNTKGQKINTLAERNFLKGTHSVVWNGDNYSGFPVGSGVYLYKLQVDGKIIASNKCLLIK